MSVALGDVDNDGDLDLLTANSDATAYTVNVRLNGGGTGPSLAVASAATVPAALGVWPNPAPANTPVRVTTYQPNCDLRVFDLTDRLVGQQTADATGAALLDAGRLAPGLYRCAPGRP